MFGIWIDFHDEFLSVVKGASFIDGSMGAAGAECQIRWREQTLVK